MEREKAAAKTKTLQWWLHSIGTPAAIFAILGGGLLYIAQAEVKPVIAKVDGEVKRLDATDVQLQKQITEVKMSLGDGLKQLNADLNAFKAQMHEDLKRVATRDHFGYLKSEMDNLKTDVGNLKSDVGSLKADVRILKADVNSLKTDVSSLKTDVKNLKDKLITPQQIRTIMREVLAEQRAR